MFNLSPIYSARKSSKHKLSKNHKICPGTNLHETKNIHKHRTQNFRRIFETSDIPGLPSEAPSIGTVRLWLCLTELGSRCQSRHPIHHTLTRYPGHHPGSNQIPQTKNLSPFLWPGFRTLHCTTTWVIRSSRTYFRESGVNSGYNLFTSVSKDTDIHI